MKESFKLPMFRYRSPEGEPTCAINFQTGEVCKFYQTSHFGGMEHCFWEQDGRLFRRKKGDGSLIPCKKCPVWEEKG